jgi:type II secretory pathway component GspD/PulD (secretin)
VTVEALNADLHHVLARLSDVTGVAITPGDTATRRISVRLAHQPLPRVLALLARSAGLGVTERDGAYYFTPGLTDAPAGFWAATARTIPLTYLAPADAVALLPDALLAAVRPNADARSVVVHGPKPLLDKIARDLEALDAPPRMCTVRAWVVTADADDAIARDWMARIAGGDTRAALTAGGAIDVALGPRAAREVLAELTLADTTGRLSVKSVPSATVITGRQARLFVGQTTYYWADDVLMSTQVGAMLRVTPRISDACIAADIRIESNTLAGRNALGPRVLRRSVETTVRLQPGAPLVVGGLRFATTDHTRGRPAEWGTTLSDMLGTRAGESAGRSAWVIISAEEVRATPSSLRETLP